MCGKPVNLAQQLNLPPELEAEIYRPGEDGLVEDVELEFNE